MLNYLAMVDRDFGNWIAGFIDGEGCFFIVKVSKRPGGFRPAFSLALRADDAAVVHQLHKALSLGNVHYYSASNGNRVVRWSVQSRADCAALIDFLEGHQLRAKKKNDFDLWKQAVKLTTTLRTGRAAKKHNDQIYNQLRELKTELHAAREEGLKHANQSH